MEQIFDNSKIRDNSRDNRDYHEIYVLMSFRHEGRAKNMNYKL